MMLGCVCCSPLLPIWAMSIRWFRSLRLFGIEVTMFVGLPARMRVVASSRQESLRCQSGSALENDEQSIGAAIPTPKHRRGSLISSP